MGHFIRIRHFEWFVGASYLIDKYFKKIVLPPLSDLFLRTCYMPDKFQLRFEVYSPEGVFKFSSHDTSNKSLSTDFEYDIVGPLCFAGEWCSPLHSFSLCLLIFISFFKSLSLWVNFWYLYHVLFCFQVWSLFKLDKCLGDRICKSIRFSESNTIDEGDIIAFLDTGAYTFGMWSMYCSRFPPQILVYSQEVFVKSKKKKKKKEYLLSLSHVYYAKGNSQYVSQARKQLGMEWISQMWTWKREK